MDEHRKIEHYIHTLPCGCAERTTKFGNLGATPVVHPNLMELLGSNPAGLRLNKLDINHRKKILNNIEALKGWISKEFELDELKRFEIVKELNKIARSFRQMAVDVNTIYQNKIKSIFLFSKAQPSLPDVFLWMICDSKRVAYARIKPEDLLFNICEGDKGLQNGRVQTIFLKVSYYFYSFCIKFYRNQKVVVEFCI